MTLIAVPLKFELDEILNSFKVQELKTLSGKLYYKLKDEKVLFASFGHGKLNYAIGLQSFLNEVNAVDKVICAGSAGALIEKYKVGDVIIGEQTVEHDYNLKFIKKKLPNFKAAEALLMDFKKIKSVHVDSIASGDEDIVSLKRASEIAKKTGSGAVAWEGAGGAKVCKHMGKKFIEIRAITDLCKDSSIEGFKINFPLAMKNLSRTLKEGLNINL